MFFIKLFVILLITHLSKASRVGCALEKQEIVCEQATYSEVQHITKELYNESYNKLTIKNSLVKKIDSNLFHQNCIGRLQQLQILNTPVTTITSTAFTHLVNLNTITIDNINIKTIKSNTFSSLPLLKTVVITNNTKLSSLSKKSFNNLIKLNSVQIDSNLRLKEIAQWFVAVPNIAKISIQNCGIKSITKSGFNELTNLTELNLSQNRFTSIVTKRFDPLINLKKLNLAQNNIAKISNNAFKENYISELDVAQLLENAPQLKTLNIHKNLFLCEHLQVIIDQLDAKEINYNGTKSLLEPRTVDHINGVVCYVSS
ncbi:protein artichoke-like [Chrysoperla carnea]|uniref:protein artichoke-like n=1 Tax=Chrysoperla carnea TaxID=189513 RepID=UPI001D05E3EC|nr:protein artichoke-like [Chrysoperla carnea]